jgi:hypothetical protein
MLNYTKCTFSGNKDCAVLAVTECPSKCSFFRTKQQQELSIRKAHRRLRGLPYEQQVDIAETYYSGKMPWRI